MAVRTPGDTRPMAQPQRPCGARTRHPSLGAVWQACNSCRGKRPSPSRQAVRRVEATSEGPPTRHSKTPIPPRALLVPWVLVVIFLHTIGFNIHKQLNKQGGAQGNGNMKGPARGRPLVEDPIGGSTGPESSSAEDIFRPQGRPARRESPKIPRPPRRGWHVPSGLSGNTQHVAFRARAGFRAFS